jgi:hypothetical protein
MPPLVAQHEFVERNVPQFGGIVTRATMSSAAGIGVSDAARRVLVEVSLLDRQPLFRLSGRNQPSCPEPDVSLGLNIAFFRVQLASTAGFEPPFVSGTAICR